MAAMAASSSTAAASFGSLSASTVYALAANARQCPPWRRTLAAGPGRSARRTAGLRRRSPRPAAGCPHAHRGSGQVVQLVNIRASISTPTPLPPPAAGGPPAPPHPSGPADPVVTAHLVLRR